MAEVKNGEAKAQEELQVAKDSINERNEFLSIRETACKADIGKVMQDLETCKERLSPGQRRSQDNSEQQQNKPPGVVSAQENNQDGLQQVQAVQPAVVLDQQQFGNQRFPTSASSQNLLLGQGAQQSIQNPSLGKGDQFVQTQQRNLDLKSEQDQKDDLGQQLVQGVQPGQGRQSADSQQLPPGSRSQSLIHAAVQQVARGTSIIICVLLIIKI